MDSFNQFNQAIINVDCDMNLSTEFLIQLQTLFVKNETTVHRGHTTVHCVILKRCPDCLGLALAVDLSHLVVCRFSQFKIENIIVDFKFPC